MAKPTDTEHSKQDRTGLTVLTDTELDQVCGGGRPALVGVGHSTATLAGGQELRSEEGRDNASQRSGLLVAGGRDTANSAQT